MAAANALDHIRAAEALARQELFGLAISHCIIAVEEAVKARVLFKWPALINEMTSKQLESLLYHHTVRHEIAQLDSLGRAFHVRLAEWRLDHPGEEIDQESFRRLYGRYVDGFPLNWARTADLERQRGLHVDWTGQRWSRPRGFTRTGYERRYRTCLDFVVSTLAVTGQLDDIADDLAADGWDVSLDRWIRPSGRRRNRQRPPGA